MNKYLLRILVFLLGTVIICFSIGIFISLGLGLDPLTVISAGVTNVFNITIGVAIVILNFCLIMATFFINKKALKLGTVLATIINGPCINFFTEIIGTHFDVLSIYFKIAIALLACVTLSLGVAITLISNLGSTPYDLFSVEFCKALKMQLKIGRPICDISIIFIGYLLGSIIGIVTFISMIFVGPLIQFFLKKISTQIRL